MLKVSRVGVCGTVGAIWMMNKKQLVTREGLVCAKYQKCPHALKPRLSTLRFSCFSFSVFHVCCTFAQEEH